MVKLWISENKFYPQIVDKIKKLIYQFNDSRANWQIQVDIFSCSKKKASQDQKNIFLQKENFEKKKQNFACFWGWFFKVKPSRY